MTMLELQDILGRVLSEVEKGNIDMEKAKATAMLAKQMINNADIVLRTDKFVQNKGERCDKMVGQYE